ncbi:MAG TPA: hypothetical protein VGX00_04550 [Thermoplasmata archaeon]|nr:hypothetical protein [Thermoplasmata archaeon]
MEPPAPGAAVPPTTGSAETLRKVKEVEADFDRRLAEIRAEGAATVARLGAETDELLRAARTAAEAKREAALSDARAQARREADAILAEARDAADQIDRSPSRLARVPTETIVRVALEGLADTTGA